MAKTLSDREVKAILQSAKSAALASMQANKLQTDRTTALNYYLGDMTAEVPKIEGRSGVVSTDVSDTIDGLMPGLMEIFCGSEEVVKFNPIGPEDVEAAEQESDFVSHVFMQKNPGFQIIQTKIKDALLSKTGITKVWWEKSDREEKETYLDQDDGALAMILNDPDVEIREHTANEDGTHDVTVVKRKRSGFAKVENVPPEEFGVSRTTKRIQDSDYCYHEPSGGKPADDLIAEGYDKAQIDSLPTYNITGGGGTETKARDTVDESSTSPDDDYGLNQAMRPIQITEHYIRMDYDKSGRAQLYKIVTGGDDSTVLLKNGKPDIVAFDYVPFAVAHCDPMPHRFFGRSMADKTLETQRIKTVLTRGLLDNIYLMNNQQVEVNEDAAGVNTIEDLMNRRLGGLVRTKHQGAITPIVVQAIADKIIPYLQYFDSEREWRTGVSREGQGLDAEALQNQSATAARQLHNASQAKMKLIARNIADGIEDLFWLLHAVIRKHGSQPETVQLRNKWVTVDPRQWKARDDMTITVGLGSGGKQEQMGNWMAILNTQAQGLQIGLIKPKHIYSTFVEMLKTINVKDIDRFAEDPGDAEMQPQQDPEMVKAQAAMQQLQAKAEIEKLQAQADIETNRLKIEADMALAREKAAMDMQMKREEHALKMEEMRMKMVGTAMSAATKGNGKDAEGNPTPPDTDLIERLMAGMNQPKPGAGRVRMRKVGPGEWVKEDIN